MNFNPVSISPAQFQNYQLKVNQSFTANKQSEIPDNKFDLKNLESDIVEISKKDPTAKTFSNSIFNSIKDIWDMGIVGKLALINGLVCPGLGSLVPVLLVSEYAKHKTAHLQPQKFDNIA